MAGMTDLAIRIATTLDSTGINKADKAVNNLQKSTVKLGKSLGIALSTTAIVAYGKSAVRAYADMQAQQDRLVRLMKVGVGATDSQIESLNKQAAALQNIGVVSGDTITQVQSQLATFNLQAKTIAALTPAILDYVTAEKGAAATTEEFKSMTNGLAQALNGNFASLTRVGFVIDENTRKMIKNGTESERAEAIVDVLNSTYKGFNASLRDTPVGQLQLLTNAADDAKEVIGEGLVDALAKIGGGSEASDAVKTIDNIAKGINTITMVTATAIDSLLKLYKAVDFITTLGGLTGEDGILVQRFGSRTSTPSTNRSASPAGTALRLKQERQQEALAAKREKERLALTKKELDARKKLTAEQKKQAALKKAGTVFDLEQIQIIAALKGKLSEEDRIRLQAQLAILNENDVLAASLTRQILMAQDSTGGLYKFFLAIGDMKIKNPFAFLDDWILEFQKKLNNLKFPTFTDPNGGGGGGGKKPPTIDPFTNPFNFPIGSQGGIGTTSIQPTVSANLAIQDTFNAVMLDALEAGNNYTQSAILAISSARYEAAAQAYGMGGSTNGTIQLELKVTGEGDITDAIAKGLQNQSLSTGDSAYINRRTGGFAG